MTEDDYSKAQAKVFIKKMQINLLHADKHISDLCREINMSPAFSRDSLNKSSFLPFDNPDNTDLSLLMAAT